MHRVYVFAAATTTCWLGFRHDLHNDWDRWNCLNDYKLNNPSSVTYWISFGHYLYHDWDQRYRLDRHNLNDYAATAARISLHYHIHNNRAGWYCLNGNKSNDDWTLSISQHVYDDWYKWHRLDCDEFNDGFCSSTATSASLNFRHNAGDNQSSGIDLHNNPKHSGHASSLFQYSTTSADERGCCIVDKFARISYCLVVDVYSCCTKLFSIMRWSIQRQPWSGLVRAMPDCILLRRPRDRQRWQFRGVS